MSSTVEVMSTPQEKAETLSIGEVAAAAAVATSRIRYYESRGLITPVERVSGRRRFEASAIRRLVLINVCTQAGFSLEECLVLLTDRAGNRARSRHLGDRKLTEIDEQIRRLEGAKQLIKAGLACRCETLEECSCQADLNGMLPSPLPQ